MAADDEDGAAELEGMALPGDVGGGGSERGTWSADMGTGSGADAG